MKQREIKFRGYDKKNKEWVYFVIPNDLNNYVEPGLKSWCQFTGLLDKNGKEIYEGDIIQNYPAVNWKVVWSEQKGQWRAVGGASFGLNSLSRNVVIIGNVYENPEPLK